MKTTISIILCLYILFEARTQPKVIDADNPIANIDVSYSVNDNLIFTLLLNSKENTQTLSGSSPVNFKATIEGQIHWALQPTNQKENLVHGTFLASSSETPFKYTADLKNGIDALIPQPTRRNWTSIKNVKIKYELDGKYSELPMMTIYPPSLTVPVVSNRIKISGKGKMLEKRLAAISVESEPSGTAFEVTDIDLVKTMGGNASRVQLNGSSIGSVRFANNGKIDLQFPTTFDLDDNNSAYKVRVTTRIIGTPNIVTSDLTDLVLVSEMRPKILNRSADYSLTINDKDVIMDADINTIGNGDIGIQFATREYSDNVKIEKTSQGNLHTFKLSGLSRLPDKSFSYFYYTANGEVISPPHLIVKEAPVLSNFLFDGINNDKISMVFQLPAFVNEDLITINIVGNDGKDIHVGGSIISRDPADAAKFTVSLPTQLTDMIERDTIRDLGFIINYNSIRLYSLRIKLFNQKLLNDKIANLISATAERPSRRDPAKIKEIVEGIVKIGEAVGNSTADAQVTAAIDTLKNGNQDQIKNTMLDIGKWALLVGKIVLPVL